MKIQNFKIITVSVFLVLAAIKTSAQETGKIKELNYAGNMISVPDNCEAKSEYELLNCNGIDIQWIYLNEEMLKSIPQQFLNQFSSQSNVKSQNEFKLKSFNSELTGKKFKLKSDGKISYRIIVSGIVNNQPLLLNIGSLKDINTNADLNELLAKMIRLE